MNSKGKDPIKVVVVGGHHTPAFAVMDELERRGEFEFHWIGHKTSLGGEATLSAEAKAVSKRGIPFYNLITGKMYKAGLKEWLKTPLGFFHGFYLLLKIRPQVVLAFGGYLAAPVVLASFIFRIPSATHEQTVVSGWANRFISRFVDKVFVSWEESLPSYPKDKTVLTGNPLRRSIFEKRSERFEFKNNLPTVYITGGKQGAHVINEAVREGLSQVLRNFNVIHQTGSSQTFLDYQKLSLMRNQLPPKLAKRYIVQEYFGEDEIGSVFSSCDLVVGRSGANTVYELAALGKPSILVPIPWSSHGEQMRNARILEDIGAALILPQKDLSSQSLLDAVNEISSNLPSYKEKAVRAKELVRLDAASKIADGLLQLAKL